MSLHKITAGSGYDYLTRQVAVQDSTEKGHVGLASYYTERGETPGQWLGSGLAGLDGLDAADPVTAEQMRNLFGAGVHPVAQQRMDALHGPGLTEADYLAVSRLGAPFKIISPDVSPFRLEVAKRLAALNLLEGVPARSAVAADARARVRTEVGREFFRAEYGRDPVDARELAGLIAKLSRPQTTAVAGFDLTFSPVKSVSTLWALADPTMAATIERCHQAAIGDALKLIEDHALYTRTGAHGVRQVNIRGLVAAAFTHRDSRAGDPDLQPDAGPASQSLAGKWQATINSPMGSQQLLLDYRLDGTALTGTVTLMGNEAPVEQGRATADGFTHLYRMKSPMGRVKVHVTGRLEGGKIVGTIKIPVGSLPFEATRQ